MATRQIQHSREHARILQGNCCIYCGQQMLPNGLKGALQCTAEHLQPRSEGGGASRDNIAAACRTCNQGRHQRPKKSQRRKGRILRSKPR